MRAWVVTYPAEGVGAAYAPASVEFVATKRDAERLARAAGGDFQSVEIPTDKAGLLKFINEEIAAYD